MAECALCALPTPDPPVAAPDVAGAYCCRGCLEVARRLGGPDAADDTAVDARAVLGATDDGPSGDAGGETAFLSVTGMHCATCEAFIEARATGHEGVLDAAASYSSGLLRVVYDPERVEEAALPGIVTGTGYDARPAAEGAADDDESAVGRLLVGGFFGMMVMLWYVLFLYPTYLGVPGDALLLDVHGTAGGYLLGNVWVMATVVLGYVGYPQLRGAYVSLRAGYPNMDLLVGLAATAAYGYSTAALLSGRTEVYFDVVVAVVVVVALGNYYEARIRRRAAGHLADLAAARVADARRRIGDDTASVPVEDLAEGDEVVVRAGERIPVDGTVIEGTAAVDESLLTGEPVPHSRGPGEPVVAGTTVADGAVVVSVDAPDERTVDRLLAHLWSVQSGHSGAQRLADRLAGVFVPIVIALAVAATGGRLLAGRPLPVALLAGLSVLVVSCPCALGLATPLSVARGVREALARGVVVTDGGAFERGAHVDVVALDKTGTLTTGEMALLDVVPADGVDGDDLLARAAAVEGLSAHPVAEAVTAAATRTPAAADFERHAGRGVSARVLGEDVVVGRRALLADQGIAVPADGRLARRAETARRDGHVPVFVGWGGTLRGLLVVGDRPRPGWADVVTELAADREVVVLTGDDASAARRYADHPGVAEVFAGLPPEAKTEVVDRLRARGTVAMVGDGTNDASALAAADVGVAIERGAALAADAADAVLASGNLEDLPAVFAIASATRRRVRWNLAWAFGYNAVAIPVAMAGLLNPLIAAVAMSASSLLVVGNSSRRLLPADSDPGAAPPERAALEPPEAALAQRGD